MLSQQAPPAEQQSTPYPTSLAWNNYMNNNPFTMPEKKNTEDLSNPFITMGENQIYKSNTSQSMIKSAGVSIKKEEELNIP